MKRTYQPKKLHRKKEHGMAPKPRAEGSSPSAPAKTIKPVFREKHRNTGFSLTYSKQFKPQFCSSVCIKIR